MPTVTDYTVRAASALLRIAHDELCRAIQLQREGKAALSQCGHVGELLDEALHLCQQPTSQQAPVLCPSCGRVCFHAEPHHGQQHPDSGRPMPDVRRRVAGSGGRLPRKARAR